MNGLLTALAGLTEIGDKVTINLTKSGDGRFRVVVLNKLSEQIGAQDELQQKLRQGLAMPIVVEETLDILEAKLPTFIQKVCEDRLMLKDTFESAKDNHREALAGSMAAQKSTPKGQPAGPQKPPAAGAASAGEPPAPTQDESASGDSLI